MRASHARLLLLALGTWCAGPSCSGQAPARPQLVLFIDTDAPLVGQLSGEPRLSADAAIDTLRIDVLNSSNAVTDTRDFLVPDRASWPVSFGVVTGGAEARVRVRIFRAALATAGTTGRVATLDPPPTVTIERVAHVRFEPTGGVHTALLFLSEDCLGTPSSFQSPETTCIDGQHLSGAPEDGILPAPGAPTTKVGSWRYAKETPCSRAGPPQALCVPGGFSILGSTVLAGTSDSGGLDPVPLRPVVVSPFYLDRLEYTVGRFRALLKSHKYVGPSPDLPTIDSFCTWPGPNTAQNDALPLNCVTWDIAEHVCELEGGALPTEAEWEHEARGRGDALNYPWGNEAATCCAASLARYSGPDFYYACTGTGLEPVGSHDHPAACRGLADVTRDGVMDMLGSVTEAVMDDLQPYDAPCWSHAGIPIDPVCKAKASPGPAGRGNYWASYLLTPLPARYLWAAHFDGMGFRCRYPGVSQ